MITIKTTSDFKVILAWKADDHTLSTGLTPKITVTQISDSAVIVNAQDMTEISTGGYYFTIPLADIDAEDAYYVSADGGATLTTYRYQAGAFYGNAGNENTIATIDTNVDSIETKVDTVDTNVDAILVDTANISTLVTTNLDQKVSLAGCGSGSITVPVYSEKDGVGLDGVRVYITSDIAGSVRVTGDQYSDSEGETVWYLDAGTYYVWQFAQDANFSNPATMTVAAE
jgi:hypothetical protein